ncbi:hypothetical protein J3369_20215 [Alteromonas sp. NFXS44]|uniref:hypothetical protein n=1 Tax=Alteromonas sp. NFXS44 TaxID=2818435 RepID=UPI0032DF077B
MRKIISLLIVLLTSLSCRAEVPSLSITLTPEFSDTKLKGIQVTEVYSGLEGSAPVFSVSRTVGPLKNVANRITELTLTDSEGVIPLVEEETKPATLKVSDPVSWRSNRVINGTAILSFSVAVSQERNTGPTWELRTDEKGISGAGITFLILAEDDRLFNTTVNWDLAAFPWPSTQINSLPEGENFPLNRLLVTYFMAGDLTSLPESDSPFNAASLQHFDAIGTGELLEWSSATYKKLSEFYDTPGLQPFTVLFRNNPLIMQSGTALPEALMVAAKKENSEQQLKQILMHEMVHVFLHGLADEAWFQEGLAIYYQDRAAYLLGMLSPQEYTSRMNETLLTYYSNVKKDMTMADATAAFWTDARARLQPYNRGAMYFFITDGRIREATGGSQSLDTVLNQFLAMFRAGEPVEEEDWINLLTSITGKYARQDFDAMQNGMLLVPNNASQGQCFTLHKSSTPLFELGFDIGSLMQAPRIIHGLNLQSPAAIAGLEEGDVVLNTISLDAQQSTPHSPITLTVKRSGGDKVISFIPAGPLTTSYEWTFTGSNEDISCF